MKTNSDENYKSLEIRFYPDENQKTLLLITFGCCRKLYNEYLNEIVEFYNDSIIPIKLNKDKVKEAWESFKPKRKTDWKEKYEYMKKVSMSALEQAILDCEDNLYELNKGAMVDIEFPSRKTKKNPEQFYKESNVETKDLDFQNRKLRLPEIGYVDLEDIERPLWYNQNCILKSIKVLKSAMDDYYVILRFKL